MPGVCSICRHPKRDDAEKAILRGETVRVVSELLGCGTSTVQRHKVNCLAKRLRAAAGAATVRDTKSALDFLAEMRRAYDEAWKNYDAAKTSGAKQRDVNGALTVVHRSLEIVGMATGILRAQKTGRPAEVDSLSDAELAAEVERLKAEAGEALH
jgi:hypothetical protein